MSMPEKTTVTCPSCGQTLEYTRWHSINTDRESALPDIISGKLFQVECPFCGQKLHMDYPLLFNDMLHRVMISYTSLDHLEEVTASLAGSRQMGYRVRIVTDQLSLREKAAVFAAGLDDRVVEILKVLALREVAGQLEGKKVEKAFYVPEGENSGLQLLVDGQPSFLPLSPEAYEVLAEKCRDRLSDGDEEPVIDAFWAEIFLGLRG